MSQRQEHNIHFVGVARVTSQAIIVASYSHNSETDLAGVKQVLEQPNMHLSLGKHYTFSVGQLAWHLTLDEMSLTYVLICSATYPQRCAHSCLEELQRGFVAKAGTLASSAQPNSLNSTCSSLLKNLCNRYDSTASIDKIASISSKVESVRLVMQENIAVALHNTVKLESIERQAEELQQQAGVFRSNTHQLKNRMWWKNMQMKLMIGGTVLVVLGIIIAIIACQIKKC